MAGNNHWIMGPTNNNWDRSGGTVHVNPNFNKPVVNSLTSQCNSIMHVNPRFPHLLPQNSLNKPKIYVNPNFIRPSKVIVNPTTIDSNKIENHQKVTLCPPTPVPSTISRYTLVRNHETKVQSIPLKTSNTVKLGRYKSVPVNYIKKTLCDVKNIENTEQLSSSIRIFTDKTSTSLPNNSRFKLINNTLSPSPNSILKSGKRMTLRKQRVSKPHLRIKIAKGNFKKNNIPCPLFRKFGNCLRNTKGRCEFLHDRKHVAVCRKFIKGLCHDPACLLSHELTAKKMPTCHFYLNGNCTKDNCPYLHVKLNEQSKICRDFLNGYCEKGTECLNRHINIHDKKIEARVSTRTRYSFRCKSSKSDGNIKSKIKFNKISVASALVIRETNTQESSETNTSETNQVKEHADCRYYQEHLDDTSSAIIKPTRCKLGPLPSFIQL